MPFGHISFALVLPSRLLDLYGSYVYRHRPADIQLQTCYNLQLRRHGKTAGKLKHVFPGCLAHVLRHCTSIDSNHISQIFGRVLIVARIRLEKDIAVAVDVPMTLIIT